MKFNSGRTVIIGHRMSIEVIKFVSEAHLALLHPECLVRGGISSL